MGLGTTVDFMKRRLGRKLKLKDADAELELGEKGHRGLLDKVRNNKGHGEGGKERRQAEEAWIKGDFENVNLTV